MTWPLLLCPTDDLITHRYAITTVSLCHAEKITQLPLVPHICVSESGQHWFRCFVSYLAQSYYLNQCQVIVNWTLRNKLQWNFNQNSIFYQRKCIRKYRLWNCGHFVREHGLMSHPCSDSCMLHSLSIIIMQICSLAMNTHGERF